MTAGMDNPQEKPPVDAEALARSLRANIQKRRPGYYRTLATTLGIVAVVLALVAWFFWPRPALPRLNILPFDQVALPGETVLMKAWLAPQDLGAEAPDLAGLEVSFEPLPFPARLGASPGEITARASSSGLVLASLAAPTGEGVLEFKVAHANPRQRYRTEDRARLFTWQPQTPLLFVEVAALADAGPDAWQGRLPVDAAPRPSAADALQAARAKNYQVVYLATGASTPLAYRLMRAWIERKSQDAGLFPDGPVLGQLPKGGPPVARDWAERLRELRSRRPGPFAAVAKDPHLAESLRDAGATTFLLTEAAETPANVTLIRTWGDFKL
jgi:hypothetical protein